MTMIINKQLIEKNKASDFFKSPSRFKKMTVGLVLEFRRYLALQNFC